MASKGINPGVSGRSGCCISALTAGYVQSGINVAKQWSFRLMFSCAGNSIYPLIWCYILRRSITQQWYADRSFPYLLHIATVRHKISWGWMLTSRIELIWKVPPLLKTLLNKFVPKTLHNRLLSLRTFYFEDTCSRWWKCGGTVQTICFIFAVAAAWIATKLKTLIYSK